MKNLRSSAPLRLKKYPAYKDSKVYWIQNVPSHWESKRLKFLAKLINNKNEACTDLQYVGLENIESWTGKLLESESIPEGVSNLFEANDVLFGKLRPYLAKVLHAKNGGICTSEALILRSNTLHPHYLFYYLLSKDFIGAVDSSTYGSKMPRASWDFIGNLPALNPSYSEQRSIASFLDRKTAEIDALIAKKRRMIELLQEKRTAVISHAVTKGLDPNAPMKDSGVEWLGKVPRHWEVLPIKRIVSVPVTDGPHETPEILDEGIPFVSAEAIRDNRIDFSRKRGYIAIKDHHRYSLKYKPKRNDIFMIKSGATTGNLAIVETDEEFNIWSPLAVIRADLKKSLPRYILAAMNSKEFQTSIQLFWSYGTQQNIGMNVIENLFIPLPPFPEQEATAAFIDRETARIDGLISKVEAAIDKLIEYRTALISAAVTGKIDVRDEVTA